jgi:hypothetical protein
VNELEMEVYPVLDELATNISTLNLEHVRRLKGRLLTLTQKVQKVNTKDSSNLKKPYYHNLILEVKTCRFVMK